MALSWATRLDGMGDHYLFEESNTTGVNHNLEPEGTGWVLWLPGNVQFKFRLASWLP